MDKALPWALRVAWATLPFVLGPAFADAVHDWDARVRTAASLLLWCGWASVAVASCVALPLCLVAVRIGVATAVVLGGVVMAPAIVAAIVAAGIAARPETAMWFVNGPAYANELRFPLKVPGPVVFGPLWLASAAVVIPPAEGVLLIAGENYLVGIPVLVVGVVLAALAGRSLFALTRRWVVFVPAGLVLHDPMTLIDPVLFERKVVEALRPAAADTDALDLTMAALGLPLELLLTEKVPMVLAKGRGGAESGASARLLFTPTRPGRVLQEAAARRLPVG